MTKAEQTQLEEFAAKDPAVLRSEIIASMRKDKPDITQEEIDRELAAIEATIGF